MKLRRKMIVGMMLASLFLSFVTFTLNVQPVKASETIYIRTDGSIEPSNVSILTPDNVTYFFTGNVTGYIVVERNDIVIDGSGFVLASGEAENAGTGIDLVDIHNVTIRNTNIRNFIHGIHINNGPSNLIVGNNIADNNGGIYIESATGEIISGNNIEHNSQVGIYLGFVVTGCTIIKNNIASNYYGMEFGAYADNNEISHNNFIDNGGAQVLSSNYENHWDAGYPSCGNYWSDYTDNDLNSGPYQNETGSDGIGDSSYIIDDSNFDNYPLMDPWLINPPDPNHMIVGYSFDLGSTLDPARCYDTASAESILNVYETLVSFDEEKTDQFVPRLATSWEISADGLTYTFRIRQGVKFHNGETLTIEDVEYSFERFMVIEGEPAWMFYEAFFDVFGSRNAEGNLTITGAQIDNAVTGSDTAVALHLVKPYPPLMQILAQTFGSILCKRWCIEIGDWPGTWNNWTLYNRPSQTAIEVQNTEPPGPHVNAMCGTGPFILDFYKKWSKLSMIRFDNYWGGWPAAGSDGSLQRITCKTMSDWGVRRNMFLDGQLDYIDVSRQNKGEVIGQPGVKNTYPLESLSCYAMFFTFNISASSPCMGVPGGLPKGTFNESGIPPDFFTDVNIRKGFACAFNYSKLIEEGLLGEAYQPATPIIPELPFYNPAQEKYTTNPDLAMHYFQAAWSGEVWDKGFNFTLFYWTAIQNKTFQIIKATVEPLNSKFHIQIQSLLPGNYSAWLRNHELAIFNGGWLADYADPHNFVYGFMYSGGAFAQWQLYSNATVDMLMREGMSCSTNETARRLIYYELQEIYHEDCPGVPLYQPIGHRFDRDWVQGWYYNPLLYGNYFYAQWKGSIAPSTTYSWPMFCHDVEHTGHSESSAPNTNHTLWSYTTGSEVFSSPAVADGKVYVGSYDNNVYCLDAITGVQIWNYTTNGGIDSSPAVADGRVYIGSNDHVYCLDTLTGALIWNYTTGSSAYPSSPAVAYGKVYIGSIDKNIYCLDASTGTLIWSYTTGSMVSSCPAVVQGKVYIGSLDHKVYCLDASSGAHIWNYTTGGYVTSSPAVVDGKVYVGSWDNKTYCLNALTGALIWNYTTGNWVFSSPAVADGKVYVGSGDNKTYCLSALTGAHIWNYTTGGFVGSSAIADGKVYVGSQDNSVYCLDASSGALIWSYATGSGLDTSPAVADGTVFIGSSDHTVYAFGDVIRVPEDYRTIQAAIDAAPPGATIWIAPGIYNEPLVINKTLTLIGRVGSSPTFSGGGSGTAIILLPGASGSIIAGIVITNWDRGILVVDSTNCKIYDNIMSLMKKNGIVIEGTNAANNLIYSNIFQQNAIAINLTASSAQNIVYKNIITSNAIGLKLESGGNVVYANSIAQNTLGINVSNSNGNIIYHNNFIDNTLQISNASSTSNMWDDGYPSGGNYWGTFACVDQYSGPGQTQLGSDGINDTGYVIAQNNIDRYPLLQPFSQHDIGITEVITSRTIVAQGTAVSIDVRILNYGTCDETFTVTIYANTTIIDKQIITVATRSSATVTFTWNTAGAAKANYTISAVVDILPRETEWMDNALTDGTVTVTIPGDVTGDVWVDMQDISILIDKFMATPTDPLRWDPNCDVNCDLTIDMADISLAIDHFMQS